MLILSQNSIQTIRLRGAYDHVDDLAFKAFVTLEIDHFMTGRMTRYIAFGPRALSFSQHAQHSSEVRLINFVLHRTLHLFKLEEACSLFRLGNVVVKLGGWRAGAS